MFLVLVCVVRSGRDGLLALWGGSICVCYLVMMWGCAHANAVLVLCGGRV